MILDATLVIAAYLLGSVSSAIVVCRLARLPDPRDLGSGNPGATNVLRTGSKAAAAATLVGDMLKGVIPVLAARALDSPEWVWALAGLAAVLGHIYPVFFRFHGGKGVATALGVLAALSWQAGLAVIATWLVVAGLFRYSSLAALVAVALAPVYLWLVARSPGLIATAVVIALVLFWRHRDNVQRLANGTESRIKLRSGS